MKNELLFALALLLFCCPIEAQQEELAFTVTLEEITNPEWPGLHSFAFAKWEGHWLIIAGRSNGLHGFFPFTGFPEQSANDQIWVFNPLSGEFWSRSLSELSPNVAVALSCSNPQYVQEAETLYVFGGYGKSIVEEEGFITFDQLTAIEVPEIINAVINEENIAPFVTSTTDDRLRVCGGEAHLLEDWVYLVGGHDFNGLYSQTGTPTFTQEYTNEIRRFKLEMTEAGPALEEYEAFSDPEYHRRDLNLAPSVLPGGAPGLCAYGGVFQPTADLPYLNPIYIGESDIIVNTDYEQLMSHYTCPILPVYDAEQEEMYSVFFGGLSYHTFDRESESFILEELIPFIPSFTLLHRKADGAISETVLPTEFDELLGTNAKLILAEDVPLFSEGILDFNAITESVEVGYIFGGIKAVIPNITPSSASNRLFKIWLHPAGPTATQQVMEQPALVKVFPNPFYTTATLEWLVNLKKATGVLYDGLGREVWSVKAASPHEFKEVLENKLLHIRPGFYELMLHSDDRQQRIPLLKL